MTIKDIKSLRQEILNNMEILGINERESPEYFRRKKNDMTKKNAITRIRFLLCLLPFFSISMFGFIAGVYSGTKSVAEAIIFVICLILDIILVFFCSSILFLFVVEENLK